MKKFWKILRKVLLILLIVAVVAATALGIYIGCTFHFGELGDGVYYALNPKTSSVVIFGDGTMPDYGNQGSLNYRYDFWDPEENKWSSQLTFERLDEIRYICFMNGVTQISDRFIESVDTVKAIYIPESVEFINQGAFDGIKHIMSFHFQGAPTVYDEAYANYWAYEVECPPETWNTWYTYNSAIWDGGCDICYEDCNNGWMDHDMWKLIEKDCTYIKQKYTIPWMSILFGIS